MAFTIRTRRASQDRVPVVEQGEAVVYTRYDNEKTVALNPADFHRLASLEDDLDMITSSDHIPLDDFALEGLLGEAAPGEPIEDAARLKTILGL